VKRHLLQKESCMETPGQGAGRFLPRVAVIHLGRGHCRLSALRLIRYSSTVVNCDGNPKAA